MQATVPHAPSTPTPCSSCAAALLVGILFGIRASMTPAATELPSGPSTPASSYADSSRSSTPSPPSRALETPWALSTPPASLGSPFSPSTQRKSRPHEEQQYLDLARNILTRGEHRPAAKGVGARTLFVPAPLRFSLSRPSDPADHFSPPERVVPLLTTKRVSFRSAREELVWMLRGRTNAHELRSGIWDANSSRAYLDARGLEEYEEGGTGPGYGFQWRHAGAKYKGMRADYSDEGDDQVARVVRSIQEEPEKRKHIICAWNVADLDATPLPPCPLLIQFYVHSPPAFPLGPSSVPRLSCVVYQRSADVALGLPFDLAVHALLAHLVAHLTGTVAAEMVFVLADAHVYDDHAEALRAQLAREPQGQFPTVEMARTREELEAAGGVDAVREDDFMLGEYVCGEKIQFKLHP